MAKKARSRKPAAKKPVRKKKTSSAPKHPVNTKTLGWITHSEFASSDTDATKTWCKKVLGWKFKPSFPMEGGGEYHLFTYSERGGGGIRPNHPSEAPGTIPYVEVANVKAAFTKAIRAGAEEMMAPSPVMEGLVIAVVRAPGGVAIGFAGPK